MKTSATDSIIALLKEKGALFDEEIAQHLSSFNRNTIRRARRDLVRQDLIEPVGTGRIVKHQIKQAEAQV